MSDVFISYSRRDKKFVHILHDALENSAKKTWVDWEDILPTSELDFGQTGITHSVTSSE